MWGPKDLDCILIREAPATHFRIRVRNEDYVGPHDGGKCCSPKYKRINKWIKIKCFSSPSSPIFGDFFELFHNFVSVLLMKLKIRMSYPPSANNFERLMPCRPCRTIEASFLEDLVPPSVLVCHIPLQLINLNTPCSVGSATRGHFFLEDFFFFFFF